MPAYNRPDTLPRAIESLLSQTCRDFALVVVEDAPAATTGAIVERYARRYPAVTFEQNERRLGMIDNWRRVFIRARELYPRSEYFAWVSDHDVWHATWLEEMVAALDAHPAVVLAYPESLRMIDAGARVERKGFDTVGITSPHARVRKAARWMLAGDIIYGLMRATALEAAGIFRHVITPDRQVLLALSIFGEFMQVHEILWYREVLRAFDKQRQRDVFFPNGAPFYIYLPSHLQHFATLLWDFGIRGKGRPAVGRVGGMRSAMTQLWQSSARQLVRVS